MPTNGYENRITGPNAPMPQRRRPKKTDWRAEVAAIQKHIAHCPPEVGPSALKRALAFAREQLNKQGA